MAQSGDMTGAAEQLILAIKNNYSRLSDTMQQSA